MDPLQTPPPPNFSQKPKFHIFLFLKPSLRLMSWGLDTTTRSSPRQIDLFVIKINPTPLSKIHDMNIFG